MPQISKELAADKWNPLYTDSVTWYREDIRFQLQNVFQDGHFVAQQPFRDHQQEAEAMAPLVPSLIAITQIPFDPAIEPRKQRAQQMLRRYAEITDAEQTP